MKIPKVSIGMPVFNGEKTLGQAIDSILKQTVVDFDLIISDNASSDRTQTICNEYALLDNRIRYFRQNQNIGASANFCFVLNQAKSEYFMWAACDDNRSIDFIEENLYFLENHPEYIASTSPVRFENSEFNEYRMGDSPLSGPVSQRLIGFFSTWHANGRFYSLIRKEPLSECSEIGKSYLGSDWTIVLDLLSRGKMNRINSGWVVLGKEGFSNKRNIFKNSRSQTIEIFIPFWFLTKFVIKLLNDNKITHNEKVSVLFSLLKLNLRALYMSVKVSLKRK